MQPKDYLLDIRKFRLRKREGRVSQELGKGQGWKSQGSVSGVAGSGGAKET